MMDRGNSRCYLGAVLFFGALLLVFLPNDACAQSREPVDLAMVARIREEGLQRSRVWAFYGELVDGFGPRLTGTPAFKSAAEWSRGRLAEWGLSDARLEDWPFGRGWTLEGFTLEMRRPRYLPLIAYPAAWSPSTAGRLIGRPVLLAGKTVEQLEAMKGTLRGAIVLTRPLETHFITEDRAAPMKDPPGGYSETVSQQAAGQRQLQSFLRTEGVGAVLEPSRGVHGTVFVLGRDAGEAALPTVEVAAEHYNTLVRLLERGMEVEVAVEIQARFHESDTNGYNVLAEIPGTDPRLADQVVMVGAHLDSWHSSPGGTDNADGVAAVLEATRILKALDVRPRRTIRIALWGGEEEGLLGSRAWVREHLEGEANRANRERFSVYFNLDPGAGPVYGFFLERMAEVLPLFEAWLEPFADLRADLLTLEPIGSTDHVPFLAAGVPGFEAIHDYVDYDVRTHHTNMDTFERIREEDLKQAAVVMAAVLYHAAMREEMLPRPPAPAR